MRNRVGPDPGLTVSNRRNRSMTRAISLPVLLCLTVVVSGCSYWNNMTQRPGTSAEFIAGNASQILIDIRHGPDSELAAARSMANDKCGVFGKTSATLISINPVGDNKDRVTFVCQ
jgi:hypothetical protein